MRLAILGSGAMGSVFGGHLALAGHDVTLVDVWREHMAAVASRGLVMHAPDGAALLSHPRATADAARLEPVDAVIVLAKGFATRAAGQSITHAVTPGTWVASLQNGLGHDRTLAEIYSADRVVPGTTTVGAEVVEPGVVRMSPATARRVTTTHLGRPRTAREMPTGVVQLAEALTDAGLPAEALDDADTVIWTKLAMAASMGPGSAVLGRTIADVWRNEHGRALVRSLFDEVIAVARAEGVALDPDETWAAATFAFANAGDNYASMAADTLAGRRTEIDSFCGEVARRGAAHGVPAPVSAAVWRMVKALEEPPSRSRPAG